jgi:hypothetical protein
LERREPDRVPTVEANAEALRRIMAAEPILVDLKLAGEVIPELAEHPRFTIPALGFRGTPTGIDARKVVELGLTPIFNTGIAHRIPGIGQIGAGFARTPLECFQTALAELEAHA